MTADVAVSIRVKFRGAFLCGDSASMVWLLEFGVLVGHLATGDCGSDWCCSMFDTRMATKCLFSSTSIGVVSAVSMMIVRGIANDATDIV